MLGDVLLIKRHHRLAAKTLVGIIMDLNIDRPVIAISGESGSGKSELSNTIGRLFKSMGKKAKAITTDDFYLTLPAERTAQRVKKGIAEAVGPQEYNWDAIYQVVDDFRMKRKSTFPCVDLLNDQVDTLTTDFSKIDILLFEGLYSIKNEKADLRILIDIPYTLTKLAQLKRGKEPMDPTRLEILKAEHKAVGKIKPVADILITETYKVKRVRV
ncbi:MAG: uridine kinase [Bacteroidetes bacterium]|nr:uridine kinase [Bacteroidota bacterium]